MDRPSIGIAFLPLLASTLVLFSSAPVAAKDYWVNADRLVRRTCPSTSCGVVGKLFHREKATVYETRDGWGRISKYYDALCEEGRSKYVDSGRADCSAENGIVNDQFAEWAILKNLTLNRPADPAATAPADHKLIADSDDYRIHKDAFAKAARELIAQGTCTASDFEEQGGWMKSSNKLEAPVYFIFCGGMTRSNRIYLNAKSGEISR